MKKKLRKKALKLLLTIVGCDQEELELVLGLFIRYEDEFGKDIVSQIIQDTKDMERGSCSENLILGILLEVLDEINAKYGLEFSFMYLEHTLFTYEFALPYIRKVLDELGFIPTLRDQIIAEFNSWKVTMNQISYRFSLKN